MSEDSAANAEAADGLSPEAGLLDEQIEEGTLKPNGRRKKMLIILGVAVVGGIILGISFTLLLSALQPTPRDQIKVSAPAPALVRDPHQESLIRDLQAKNRLLEEQARQQSIVQTKPAEYSAPRDDNEQIKELKEKNEKLEEQLRLSRQAAPPPVRSFAHGKPSNAKVAEDCTITDQTVPLGEKLKSCVEDFNRATR